MASGEVTIIPGRNNVLYFTAQFTYKTVLQCKYFSVITNKQNANTVNVLRYEFTICLDKQEPRDFKTSRNRFLYLFPKTSPKEVL